MSAPAPTPRQVVSQASKLAFLTKTPTFASYGYSNAAAVPEGMLNQGALPQRSAASMKDTDFWAGAKYLMYAQYLSTKSYSAAV